MLLTVLITDFSLDHKLATLDYVAEHYDRIKLELLAAVHARTGIGQCEQPHLPLRRAVGLVDLDLCAMDSAA